MTLAASTAGNKTETSAENSPESNTKVSNKNSAQNNPATHFDVLILGAGLAGLSAAHNLRDSDLKVAVLEAADRTGGRTEGQFWEAAGRKIDMGGTWLLPHFDESFALLKKFGIETVESPSSKHWLVHLRDGVQVKRFLNEDEAAELEELAKRLEAIKAASDKPLSAAEAFAALESETALDPDTALEPAINPVVKDWHLATQRYLAGAPLEDVSVDHLLLDLDDLKDPEHYHTQIGGTTDSLISALTDSLTATLKLETPVTQIKRAGAGYAVTAGGTVYTANALVVAIPQNTLGDIEIDAEILGDYAQLVGQKHVGASRKDWFVLDGVPDHFRVFASHGPYGYFRSEDKLSDTTMLCVGLAPSHEADPSVTELADQIRQYLPDAKVVAHTSFDWNDYKWSKGTWFVPRPGQYDEIAAATAGTPGVFFVGGDFDADNPGTLEGAIASGKKAAEAIKLLSF